MELSPQLLMCSTCSGRTVFRGFGSTYVFDTYVFDTYAFDATQV
jgi:hypothetical protein